MLINNVNRLFFFFFFRMKHETCPTDVLLLLFAALALLRFVFVGVSFQEKIVSYCIDCIHCHLISIVERMVETKLFWIFVISCGHCQRLK